MQDNIQFGGGGKIVCRRGEIYYVENGKNYNYVGQEQKISRPAIIVSNDKCNRFSNYVEVVYLTTQEKTDLPTHVDIYSIRQLCANDLNIRIEICAVFLIV